LAVAKNSSDSPESRWCKTWSFRYIKLSSNKETGQPFNVMGFVHPQKEHLHHILYANVASLRVSEAAWKICRGDNHKEKKIILPENSNRRCPFVSYYILCWWYKTCQKTRLGLDVKNDCYKQALITLMGINIACEHVVHQ